MLQNSIAFGSAPRREVDSQPVTLAGGGEGLPHACVLCCAVLYCSVCAVLHCSVLHCTMCAMLHCTVLRTTLHRILCAARHCSVHCFVHCAAPFVRRATPHCVCSAALHCAVPHPCALCTSVQGGGYGGFGACAANLRPVASCGTMGVLHQLHLGCSACTAAAVARVLPQATSQPLRGQPLPRYQSRGYRGAAIAAPRLQPTYCRCRSRCFAAALAPHLFCSTPWPWYHRGPMGLLRLQHSAAAHAQQLLPVACSSCCSGTVPAPLHGAKLDP